VTVDKSVGASECSKLDGAKSSNSVSQANMESHLLRLPKKTRETAQPTEDVVAEMLKARSELKATSVLETTVVGSCTTASEVLISHVGEGYLSQNEEDSSRGGVSNSDIVSLEKKDLDELARFETRDHESERLFDMETLMPADLHDQAHMTGSIALIGEKGIECSEGKMLRQGSGTKDITEKSSVSDVVLTERKGPVYIEEITTLAGLPAMFCYFAESSVVVGNTGEDLRSGEVYDATISSDGKSARLELFYRYSDEPQEDLNCSKDVLLDPSVNEQEEKHGEVSLEDENAEESWSLFEEESDRGSFSTLAWSLKKSRVEASRTKHLVLEGGGFEFVADIALAKYALLEYPDPQAQPVSAGHPGGCVSFLYERNKGVSQSGACATLHHEGDFNGNELRRRVFDPGGLGLRCDYCRGCCRDKSFTV